MITAVYLKLIVNINSQYCLLIRFSIGFSELIGGCPSDVTNPSSPPLLFAELLKVVQREQKECTIWPGMLWQLISCNRALCSYLFYKNLPAVVHPG